MTGLILASLLACNPGRHLTPPHGDPVSVHGKLWASVFQQRAGEYKALCLQAFNIATLRVDQSLSPSFDVQAAHAPLPAAVITDIDETFLDNSPYAVTRSLDHRDYDQASWEAWTALGRADTLPGALAFFNHCKDRSVEVFYITNRTGNERPGTLANLKRFGFPYADEQHLVTRATESSKEARRLAVAQTHRVILLLGDNLADFSSLFDKKPEADRNQRVLQNSTDFGNRFIILPNISYGGWEDAIYSNHRDLSAPQKDSALLNGVKGVP